MAKVDEKAKFKPDCLQIIENLRSMLVIEFGNRLQLDDYFAVANKISEVFLAKDSASILQGQCWLRDCWNAAILEFNAETFLVNRLVKAAALV